MESKITSVSIPTWIKCHYSSLFLQMDRRHLGFITVAQANELYLEKEFQTHEIWKYLEMVPEDALSIDDFILISHACETKKKGQPLVKKVLDQVSRKRNRTEKKSSLACLKFDPSIKTMEQPRSHSNMLSTYILHIGNPRQDIIDGVQVWTLGGKGAKKVSEKTLLVQPVVMRPDEEITEEDPKMPAKNEVAKVNSCNFPEEYDETIRVTNVCILFRSVQKLRVLDWAKTLPESYQHWAVGCDFGNGRTNIYELSIDTNGNIEPSWSQWIKEKTKEYHEFNNIISLPAINTSPKTVRDTAWNHCQNWTRYRLVSNNCQAWAIQLLTQLDPTLKENFEKYHVKPVEDTGLGKIFGSST